MIKVRNLIPLMEPKVWEFHGLKKGFSTVQNKKVRKVLKGTLYFNIGIK